MNVPRELKYRRTHEWVRADGNIATVGISDFAQRQLSDLTFVELPEVDDEIAVAEEVGVVESVKAASDVYAPLTGRVVEVNAQVLAEPELVNTDPYGDGWLFKIEFTHPEELQDLFDADAYEEQLPEEEE